MNWYKLPLLVVALTALALPSLAVAKVKVVTEESECTGPPSDTRLYVTISKILSGTGWIAVTLYEDKRRKFLAKNGSLYVGRIVAKQPVTRVCIYVPEPDYYALAIYHDENTNSRFDRTGLGLPAEGYGFSNNASTILGLPSFKSVRMYIAGDGIETAVRMKYP